MSLIQKFSKVLTYIFAGLGKNTILGGQTGADVAGINAAIFCNVLLWWLVGPAVASVVTVKNCW